MRNISDFLKHLKFNKSYEFKIKSIFIDLIKQQFDIELDAKELKIADNLIYLDLKPKIKTLIKMNKNPILKRLNNLTQDQEIKDII